MTLPEVEQKLRGAAGSEVTLMIRRGSEKPFEVKVKRAAPGNVPECRETAQKWAISAMSVWLRSTPGHPTRWPPRSRICDKQAGNKLAGFIVDLRNNPGGSFDDRCEGSRRVYRQG